VYMSWEFETRLTPQLKAERSKYKTKMIPTELLPQPNKNQR